MARPNKRQNPKWVELEREVASLYRTLGYVVKRDELLDHNQIDLVATRNLPGAQPIRLAIEVKHRSSGQVPIDEVRDFLNCARDLLAQGKITSATMVSNAAFTKGGKAKVVDDARLRLTTLEDLRRELFINEDYLRSWCRTYESSRVCRRYIDVQLDPAPASHRHGILSGNELLSAFDNKTIPRALILLADYGAGKTTLLNRIRYIALQRYLDSDAGPLPIIFQLKQLLSYPTLDHYVAQTLIEQLGSQGDVTHFWNLVRERSLLLLFDGFDEIAVQPTAAERAEYMARIAPLFFSECYSILSSRPSYFANQREYERLITAQASAAGLLDESSDERQLLGPRSEALLSGLRSDLAADRGDRIPSLSATATYVVSPLDTDQIKQYVEKLADDFRSVGIANPQDVLTFLDEVYDLSELVTRPILLEMVMETILRAAVDIYMPASSIGPAELYEIYTKLKLADDYDKAPARRGGLSADQRREFAEMCASRMNSLETLTLARPEAEELARSLPGYKSIRAKALPSVKLEMVMTDLRTCSFLTIGDDGSLRFIHKSFSEFFLASRIRQALVVNRDLSEVAQTVPNETLYFLGAMTHSVDSRSASDIHNALIRYLDTTDGVQDGRSRESQIRSNLLGALFYGREEAAGLTLKGGLVPRVKRKRLHLSQCSLSRLTFDDLEIGSMQLAKCTFADILVRGNIRQLSAVESIVGLDIQKLGQIELKECRGSVKVRQSAPQNVIVGAASDVELEVSEASGRVVCSVADSSLRVLGARSAQLEVRNSSLRLIVGDERLHARITAKAERSVVALGSAFDADSLALDDDVAKIDGIFSRCVVVLDPSMPLTLLKGAEFTDCLILGGAVERESELSSTGTTRVLELRRQGSVVISWLALRPKARRSFLMQSFEGLVIAADAEGSDPILIAGKVSVKHAVQAVKEVVERLTSLQVEDVFEPVRNDPGDHLLVEVIRTILGTAPGAEANGFDYVNLLGGLVRPNAKP